jgi:AGZA family xanthine/uracil permease-like MFS transporter
LTATNEVPESGRYHWAAAGDVNAFFGLMLDNVGGMILMAGLLVGVFGFPAEFVLTRMIPGTAIGVLVGDLIYTGMAFRLARRERRDDVTAMPLGLDTPSTFGAVFLILGPAFGAAKGRGMSPEEAATHAWFVGIAMLLASGVFKLACATVSGLIRRVVPRAGLLGSLVSIALVLISFLPLLDIAGTPVAGMVALAIILVTLTARWELPGAASAALASAAVGFTTAAVLMLRPPVGADWWGFAYEVPGPPILSAWAAIPTALVVGGLLFALLRRAGQVPGALMAVALGGATFYALHLFGFGPGPEARPTSGLTVALPFPVGSWLDWVREPGVWEEVLGYLPVAIPLALATVVGGIDCAESAAAAGDDYPTGPIIAVEGFATLVAGIFGGVIQTTPYIGHPAYKAMGGRAGYTFATALFVGASGVFGFFGWIFAVLPRAVVFPILVFVGLEITAQSFRATPRRHYPALVLACVPALAYLAYLMVDRLTGEVDRVFGPSFGKFGPDIRHWIQTLTVLAGGFIVTSLIWGTALARVIDGRMRSAAVTLVLGGALALFGVIHSPLRSGPILPPWTAVERLREQGRLGATSWQTPYHWASAYVGMAAALLIVGLGGKPPSPEHEDEPRESMDGGESGGGTRLA